MQPLQGGFKQKLPTPQPTKPSVLISKGVPSRCSPKVMWISQKSPILLPLEHTGVVAICKAPHSTYKHTQKSGVLAQPRLWHRVQRWAGVCDPRLAAQEPGRAQTPSPTTGNTRHNDQIRARWMFGESKGCRLRLVY